MICRACGKLLIRRAGERPSVFSARVVCNRVCQIALLRACVREMDSKPVPMPCRGGCGRDVIRTPRLRGHVMCRECENAARCKRSMAYRAKRCEEARRYRILMAAMGFEDFAELLTYLKQLPWVELDGRRMRNLYAEAET